MNDKPNLRLDLPALPFGGAIAKVSSDITMFSERMATVITSLNYYEAIGHPDDFMSKTHSLMLDDLKLVANVNTPIAVDVGSSEDITLMIPFHGECISTVGGHCYAWRAGQSAMFLPAAARGGHSSERATVMIDFDPDHLQRVAATMLNAEENVFVDLRLHEPRLLALQWGSLSFELIFRQICRMIDPLCAQPEVLRQLGVDDLIYRNAVMMLRPELFLANSLQSPVRDKQDKLDRLCDYLVEHLDHPLTLTDLERLSAMSARSLQYAFQRRFNCTPMQWIREQRLLKANEVLMRKESEKTVTEVALDCGFGSVNHFSVYYRKRFGRTPSELTR